LGFETRRGIRDTCVVARRGYHRGVPSLVELPSRPAFEPQRVVVAALAMVAAVAAASIVVAFLESPLVAISDASPVYLVSVVLVGSRFGMWAGIATAIASFLTYDLLFIEPRFSLIVADPRELLDLVLFLFLAVVVGRLAALGLERAAEATRRASESNALFAMSRILAIAPDLDAAAAEIVERLVRETGLERVWIATERGGQIVILADSEPGRPLPVSAFTTSLVRTPGDTPARWVRSHDHKPAGGHSGEREAEILRVRMEADGAVIGAVKATRARASGQPSRETTRLLALAADQLALAIRHDELRREATEAEIARQGDALKSALLDAVSHDLRTPLASIRATAGSLSDPDMPMAEDAARSAGAAIDLEAQRLDRLVHEVLDLSRIEAGALRPDFEALDLRDVVERAVDRLGPLLGERPVTIDLPDELPPVRSDPVLLDTIVGNLVENAGRYAAPPAPLAISAVTGNGLIRLVVEDGGPGVPARSLPRLFDKFYRVDRLGGGSRRGLGIGLAVVRGLAEGMGGTVVAGPSPLGGLRIVVELPVAATPPGDEASSSGSALVPERQEAAGSEAAGSGAAVARTPR
jgi:two-component system, OmpR family, sensor histidine kinase KdpD